MSGTQHKFADILRALADRKPIQWRNKGFAEEAWKDTFFNNPYPMCDLVTGCENSCYEFRIKPTMLKYRRYKAQTGLDTYVRVVNSTGVPIHVIANASNFRGWIDHEWQEVEE